MSKPRPAPSLPPRTPVRIATGVGLCLLIISGLGYQWLATRYARASQSIPIPRGTLEQLPLEIGGWQGEEVPISERIIQATDSDDHVNRVYSRPEKRQRVALWVAYGVRFRDLMPHRPEVCYPGNGWTLEETRSIDLTAGDGTPLPCRLLRFSRGALRSERLTVLNYYLIDGEYSHDISTVRDRIWRFNNDIQSVTQLQITCSEAPLQPPAEQSVSEFAVESAPLIRELVEQAVAEVMNQSDTAGRQAAATESSSLSSSTH